MTKRTLKSLLADRDLFLRSLRDIEAGQMQSPPKVSYLAEGLTGPRLDYDEELIISIQRRLWQIEAEIAVRK